MIIYRCSFCHHVLFSCIKSYISSVNLGVILALLCYLWYQKCIFFNNSTASGSGKEVIKNGVMGGVYLESLEDAKCMFVQGRFNSFDHGSVMDDISYIFVFTLVGLYTSFLLVDPRPQQDPSCRTYFGWD